MDTQQLREFCIEVSELFILEAEKSRRTKLIFRLPRYS